MLDNVRIAMNKDVKYGLVSSFLHLPTYQKEEKRLEEAAMDLLKLMKLDHKKDELAKNLPYGEQRHFGNRSCHGDEPALLLLDDRRWHEPGGNGRAYESDRLYSGALSPDHSSD